MQAPSAAVPSGTAVDALHAALKKQLKRHGVDAEASATLATLETLGVVIDSQHVARTPLQLLLLTLSTLGAPAPKTVLEVSALLRVARAAVASVGPAVLRRLWSGACVPFAARLDHEAPAVRVQALDTLGALCAAMEAPHWTARDAVTIVLRGLALALHPHEPVVREAAHRFARTVLSAVGESAVALHGAVVDWALHCLEAKKQQQQQHQSNAAALQRVNDTLLLLPHVAPWLNVTAALRLLEPLLSMVAVARLNAAALDVFCAFFEHTTVSAVPVRLTVAVQSLVGRMASPSLPAVRLHCAMLRHLPAAAARDSLGAVLAVASTSTVAALVDCAFDRLTQHISHVPVAALYASATALCAAPFAALHARVLALLLAAAGAHRDVPMPAALLRALAGLEQQPKAAAVMGAALRLCGPAQFVAQLQPGGVAAWPAIMRALCAYGHNSSLQFLFTLLRMAPPDAVPPPDAAAPALATLPPDLDQCVDAFVQWVTQSLAARPLYPCQALSALVSSLQQPAPPHYAHALDDETRARHLELLRVRLTPLVAALTQTCVAAGAGAPLILQGATRALTAVASLLPDGDTQAAFRAALEQLLRAQAGGADTTPHYAVLSCYAPLLDGKHAQWLWDAIRRGVLQGRKGDVKLLALLAQNSERSGFLEAHGDAVMAAMVKGSVPTHAKRHRLAVWRCLALRNVDAVLQHATVEIVYGLRESQKARREASRVLSEVVCALPTDQLSTFVQARLGAVLALPDAHAISAAMAALTTIVNEGDLDPNVSEVLLRIAVSMLRSASLELAHAVLDLLTVAVNRSLCGSETVGTALSLIRSMPDAMQTALRRAVKVLVERSLKRFGVDECNAMMKGDGDGKRLVQVLAKQRRKKAAAQKKGKAAQRASKAQAADAATRFVPGTYEDVLETAGAANLEPAEDWGDDLPDFPVDAKSGKMLIEGSESSGDDDDDDDDADPDSYVASEGDDDDDDEDGGGNGDGGDASKKGAARTVARKPSGMTGEMYRPRKAAGDIKKGKFDPFAYVKLDPKTLNRRRIGRTADQFKDVLMKRKRPVVASGHKRRVGKKEGGRFYSK